MLASPPSPYKTSRLNAYMKAGGYSELAQGLKSFYTAHCAGGRSVNFDKGDLTNDLWDRTQLYALGGAGITNTDTVPHLRAPSRAPNPRSAARRIRTPTTSHVNGR